MSELDDENQIRETMRDIVIAFREGDPAPLDRIFADDFTFTDPAGPVIGKQQWLADLASGDLTFDSVEPGAAEFRHLGDTVLVLGRVTFRGRYSKSDYNGSFRYIGVYTKRGDEWKLVLTAADRDGPAPG